jgi:hypothetical protein
LQGVIRIVLKREGQDVPVQLIVLQSKWADVVFKDIEKLKVLGCSVSVVNWQAFVLMKLYAGGAG